MSGGGKGGKKTEETTIPDWIRDPAIRNLARAEAVQRIPYMPYYGPDVAAFTPTQNAAFDQNIGAAEAFGLLAPDTLTATSGMPTPTEYAGGFTGYSSQPMYEQALAELKAKQPDAVAQYDALFGSNVPTTWGGGGGGRFRGGASPGSPPGSPPRNVPLNMSQADKDMMAGHMDRIVDERGHLISKDAQGRFVQQPGAGVTEAQDNWKKIQAAGGYAAVQQAKRDALTSNFDSEDFAPLKETRAGTRQPTYQSPVVQPALDEVIYNYNQKKK